VSQLEQSIRQSVADRLRPTPYDVDPNRSFLPYLRFKSRTGGTAQVSRAALQAAGDGGTDPSLMSTTEDIRDDNNDGIPDHINLVSGTGDTFRVLAFDPGKVKDLPEKVTKEKGVLEGNLTKSGLMSTLKDQVTSVLGMTRKEFNPLTGREEFVSNPASFLLTGPLAPLGAVGKLGEAISKKTFQPKLQDAIIKAALGQDGFKVGSLGGGAPVVVSGDGEIIGDKGLIDSFLQRTGRTQSQLIKEIQSLGDSGRGYLGGLRDDFLTLGRAGELSSDDVGKYNQLIYDLDVTSDQMRQFGLDFETPEFLGFQPTDLNTPPDYSNPLYDYGDEFGNIPDSEETTSYSPPTYDPGIFDQPEFTGYTPPDNSDSGYDAPSPSSDSSSSGSDYSFGDTGFGTGDDKYGALAAGGHVQGTGFVSGPPNQYTKKETVADTENRKVKEGSFVLNAPTVEKLMKQGVLPKGVDKSRKKSKIKASKGGFVDVALSKGEIVLAPEDAKKIGYNFLNKLNDTGKAEVSRRQRNA